MPPPTNIPLRLKRFVSFVTTTTLSPGFKISSPLGMIVLFSRTIVAIKLSYLKLRFLILIFMYCAFSFTINSIAYAFSLHILYTFSIGHFFLFLRVLTYLIILFAVTDLGLIVELIPIVFAISL